MKGFFNHSYMRLKPTKSIFHKEKKTIELHSVAIHMRNKCHVCVRKLIKTSTIIAILFKYLLYNRPLNRHLCDFSAIRKHLSTRTRPLVPIRKILVDNKEKTWTSSCKKPLKILKAHLTKKKTVDILSVALHMNDAKTSWFYSETKQNYPKNEITTMSAFIQQGIGNKYRETILITMKINLHWKRLSISRKTSWE